MRAPALLAALLLSACLPYTAGAGPETPRTALWIEAGMEKVTCLMVTQSGATLRLGTVYPGRAARLWLPQTNGRTVLVCETMRGRAEYVADLTPTHSDCWSWEMPMSSTAIQTFPVPCDATPQRRGHPVALDTLPTGWLRLLVHEEWGAYTACATRPKTWYGHEITPAMRPMIEAHEVSHREWMAQFPSCADFYIWMEASRANEIELEARAFCAGARTDAAVGRFRSLDDAITQHAAWLSHGYGDLRLTEARAEAEIRKYCGPRGTP